MKDIKKLSTKIEKLNILLGTTSTTYKSQIVDIFIAPNEWILATDVYRYRMWGLGYPFLPSDNFSIIFGLSDTSIRSTCVRWRL